jgi:hypothetical protein
MFRKLTIIALISCRIYAQYSVCASGCTHTTIAAAYTTAVAAQGSNCVPMSIKLTAGESYSGKITPPTKSCKALLSLRSSRLGEIPNRRVTSADAAFLAVLVSPGAGEAVVEMPFSANGYAFEGLEIRRLESETNINYGLFTAGVLSLGHTPSQFVQNLRISKCLVTNPSGNNLVIRGISLMGTNGVEIVDSSISNIVASGNDTQAIWCSMCQNVMVRNNALSATGENFMAGGGGSLGGSEHFTEEPQRRIQFLGNFLWKDPSWKNDSGSGAPTGSCPTGAWYRDNTASQNYRCISSAWATTSDPIPTDFVVKNLWEIKDCGECEAYGNVLQDSWSDDQSGQAFFVNNTGTRRFQVLSLSIRANLMRRINQAFGHRQYTDPSGTVYLPMTNLRFEHNLSVQTAPPMYSKTQSARLFALHSGRDYFIQRNTIATETDTILNNGFIATESMGFFPFSNGNWAVRNNIIHPMKSSESYPINVDGASNNTYCPLIWPATWTGPTHAEFSVGVWTQALESQGPCSLGNFGPWFPSSTLTAANRAAVTDGSYRPTATYAGMGADIDLVNAATNGVEAGTPNPFLDVKIRSAVVASTTASIYYTSLDTSACTVVVTGPGGSSVSETGVGRDRVASVTGLTTKSQYTASLTCGSGPTISREFITL